MYPRLLILCLLFIVCRAGAETIPWSTSLNDVERWQKNSSGEMTIRADQSEAALRIDADFSNTGNGNYWVYPGFELKGGEDFARAKSLSFDIKTDQPGDSGFRDACIMINRVGGTSTDIRYSPPGNGGFQTVTIPLDGLDLEAPKALRLRIGLNPEASKVTFFLRNIRLDDGLASQGIDTALAVKAAAPGTMFYNTEPLMFEFAIPGKADYVISDIYGTMVATGKVLPGRHVLAKLPRGYYFLSLSSSEHKFFDRRSFAVVAERLELPPGKESNYAIDAAQLDIAWANPKNRAFPGPGYSLLNELCRRSGTFTARDRSGWPEPEPGKFVWGQRMTNARELAERGITITGMMEGAPGWSRTGIIPVPRGSDGGGRVLPDDLRAIYRYTKAFARDFKGLAEFCEFWNEPDIRTDAAWDYAAASKAAFLGMKAGNPEIKVLSGSYCNAQMVFPRLVMENGGAEYFDLFNYHTYKPLTEYPALMEELRSMLADYGAADRAIVFTENGTHSEGDATEDGYLDGMKKHNFEQEMLLAEFTPKSQILLQSLGAAIDYSFVLGAYNEAGGSKDWGLVRRDYSAKPALVAFATLSNALAAADYLGEFDPAPGVRGFLFRQPDGSQTLALWRESALDREEGIVRYQADEGTVVTIPQPDGEYLFRDCFGTPAMRKAVNGVLSVPVSNLTGYLSGLKDLKPQKPAPGRGTVGVPKGTVDRTIVFRIIPGPNFEISSTRLYSVLQQKSEEVTLQVFNFSDEAKTGTLNISGVSVSPLPGTVAVPANGMTELKFSVTPQADVRRSEFRVNGVFGDKPVTPAVMPILSIANLKATALAGTAKAANWQNNSSGTMKVIDDPAENAVRVEVDFPMSNRWVYPEYVLALPEESLNDVHGIRFEIKVDPETAEAGYRDAVIFLVGEDGGYGRTIGYTAPKDGEWHCIQSLFMPMEDVRRIRIGFNPTVDRAGFRLRNIEVLKAE